MTSFLPWLLQFYQMSCLSWIYLSKEVYYVSIDQLEVKLDIKMCFQFDPNFYIFEQNLRGWEFVSKVGLFLTWVVHSSRIRDFLHLSFKWAIVLIFWSTRSKDPGQNCQSIIPQFSRLELNSFAINQNFVNLRGKINF